MKVEAASAELSHEQLAPYPGSKAMPRWDIGELPVAPKLTLRSWTLHLGPGLVAAGAAIGGGEWLAGPMTTARYGGAILWLATVSIIVQVIYNLEICRYTLYCGEPIFTGKFRILPGPLFWLVVYLFLDFGSVFPYLIANAATPLAALILGEVPSSTREYDLVGMTLTGESIIQSLQYVVFLLVLLPLIFGGKVFNALKAIMTFKVVVVFGFLVLVAVLFSTPQTWAEILSGFAKFGTVPVVNPDPSAPPGVDNVFVALWQGRPLPAIDLSMIAVLGALAAISGNGGLTNTALSGYTRDQGWGMGKRVGAIPSAIGGQRFELSHVGMVFPLTSDSISHFRSWYRFLMRDQLVVWLPACFVGVALPSMLSVQFLPRGTEVKDRWIAASMTADGLRDAAAPQWGQLFWLMALFCGFLVLAPAAVTTVDGALRRWVDLFWTAIPLVRRWDPHRIRWLYFTAVCAYAVFGLTSLTLWDPRRLLEWATNIYNYALGFSCFHVLAVNLILLPRQLRPNWFIRFGLVFGGLYFTALAVIATVAAINRPS
ncbi:MAG: Nramp family divalent metal transporter [Planctomycetes bacterium]|nr:Nramp family divalent metal transporter [Planctomycetota bacterium]